MSISVKSVSYAYAPERPALKELSLELADGEFTGILGGSGSGKTTLALLLAGLLKPCSGQIMLDGEDINGKKYDRDGLRTAVGVLFQRPQRQLFERTVERDICFALRRSGWTKNDMSAAARTAAERVGLDFDAVRDASPLSFSDGEKRRIAMAGVLVTRPRLLILDEPLAGLDPEGRRAFLKILGGLNRDGVTVLMLSRDADALCECAGRIAVLKDGGLFRDGKPQKVFSDCGALSSCGISIPQVCQAAAMLGLPQRTVSYRQLLAALITVCGGEGK